MAKNDFHISESQIEDALVSNLQYVGKLLQVEQEPRLIARQLRLQGGAQRIDLLVSCGSDLHLLELKKIEFARDFINQIIGYRDELVLLQKNNSLVSGKLFCHLVVTDATIEQKQLANQQGINVIVYDPLTVLEAYYKNLSNVAKFLTIKPNDYGVMNIGNIHKTLLELYRGKSDIEEISKALNIAPMSARHFLKLGLEFGLVRTRNQHYFLTGFGDTYMDKFDDANLFSDSVLINTLTQNQIDLLKTHIAKDPFYSSTIFGIYSIVESAFLLSRNNYPIELKDLKQMFKIVGGKTHEWQSSRALTTATYTFLNFAVELELLGKISKQIVITPSGFKFILMLQLHKSIEMIEVVNG